MLWVSRELNDKSMSDGSPRCSDPWDDLDPSLVHRLEPLSLLLGILVRDGADEVVGPAALADLALVPLGALINWARVSLGS
jgi:hypothetical protein